MINSKKMLIWETILLIIIIAMFVLIFVVETDLGVIKIASPQSLIVQHNSLKDMNSKILNSKNNYDNSLKTVETAKRDYSQEKEKYEAITDETIEIIKEATADEQYNIDYIWITIGNYASMNNLELALVEPGGSSQAASNPETNKNEINKDDNKTDKTNKTDNNTDDRTTTNTENNQVTSDKEPQAENKKPPVNTPNQPATNSKNDFAIKVVGDYINVSSFIFELENDMELRFKLDNIKMEYAGNNKITATFAVKNLKFKK